MKTDPNEPAFPSQPLDATGAPCGAPQLGLTIRQHYAGLALQGLLAQSHASFRDILQKEMGKKKCTSHSIFAREAVMMADALLEALNAPPAQEVKGDGP